MKRSNRALALFLALAMTFALSVGGTAAWDKNEYASHAAIKTPDDVAADLSGKTVILHSNDVHGQIEGYAYIAALKTAFEAKGAEAILADLGDFSQGTPHVSISKGANAVEMMNAAGYDLVTLGNHEFDYGSVQLRENLKKAAFKVLCANVLATDGSAFCDPAYILETKGGLKLGFFGMGTPETQTKVNPAAIEGLAFLDNTNGKTGLYDCAQEQVDALKAENVDLVIGLAHLGVDAESAPDGHRSIDMYAHTAGIDFIIDGHSHTVMTAGEDGEPIQSAGAKFANIGVIIIDNAAKKIESNYLIATKVTDADGSVTGELPRDEAVAAAAKKISDAVDAEYGAVFAKSEVELEGEKAPGNRTQETNNGDLITDAMLWNVTKDGTDSITVPTDNIVAITNGGGIRAPIKAGDISMKDVNTVLPFGNTIAVVYVTGAELLEALEASTYCTPTSIGGYPQTSGIKFTIDTTKAYQPNAETYPGATYYGPAAISRVSIESVNGKDFDLAATYAVVTNNFCAAGGDTYYAFKAASAQFDTGIPLDEAVVAYVTEKLDGVITAARYGKPDGEQTQIPAVNAEPEEVAAPAAPAAPATPVAPAEPAAPALDVDSYVVVAGDSLWKIAQKLFGAGTQWNKLYELNRATIKHPDTINIGQILKTR